MTGKSSMPENGEICASGKELILQAFENNTDLKIERQNVEKNQANLLMQRAIFDPQFSTSSNMSDYVSIINEYDTTNTSPDNRGLRNDFIDTRSIRAELSQLLPTGGRLSLVGMESYLDNSYYQLKNSKGAYSYPYQETYTSRAFIMLSHPILRNAGIDSTMAEIRIARLGNKIANESWKLSLCRTAASVYRKYIDLWSLQSELRLTQKALSDLRQSTSKETSPEAAQNIEKICKQLNDRIGEIQGNISNINRSLVHDLYRPPDWSQYMNKVHFIASHPLENTEEPPSLDSENLMNVVQTAPEYKVATHSLSQQEQRRDKNQNQTLPDLELYGRVGYVGLSDNMFESAGENNISNNEWEIGLRFSIPLGDTRERALEQNSNADVNSAKYRLEKMTFELHERLTNLLQNRRSQYVDYCNAKKDRESLQAQGVPKPQITDEITRFLQAQKRELNALAQCERTRLDWEVTTGQLLERFGIVLDE